MIWLAFAALSLAALAPLLLAARPGVAAQGAREPAVALHRAQLHELERDLAEGRIPPAEHAAAVLEVQRRLLSAADAPDRAARTGPRTPLVAAALLVPAAALGLYLVGGVPGMPSVTSGSAEHRDAVEADLLLGQLRARLRAMDPKSDQARIGYVLLGNVEQARGNAEAAVQAWRTALGIRFDPQLAVRAVGVGLEAGAALTDDDAALLRRALAEGAADAPWRAAVEAELRRTGQINGHKE